MRRFFVNGLSFLHERGIQFIEFFTLITIVIILSVVWVVIKFYLVLNLSNAIRFYLQFKEAIKTTKIPLFFFLTQEIEIIFIIKINSFFLFDTKKFIQNNKRVRCMEKRNNFIYLLQNSLVVQMHFKILFAKREIHTPRKFSFS